VGRLGLPTAGDLLAVDHSVLRKAAQQLPASQPDNPIRSLPTGPAQAVLDRGKLSGRMVPVAFHPAGGKPGPLPVALTLRRPLAAHHCPDPGHPHPAAGAGHLLWSADPADWHPGVTADQHMQRVLAAVRPGAIVLLHDGGGDRSATVAALAADAESLGSRRVLGCVSRIGG
jgi:hypothetical protein